MPYPTMHCHDVLRCLVICLALCFACITTCLLRSHETTRSLRFASMLAKQRERFVLCEQNKRFVVCEQNKLFIDLLRSHVVSTFLWSCLFLSYPVLPCLCFALPCPAFVLPGPALPLFCPTLPCTAMTSYAALLSVLHYVSHKL